jgi:capsid protein
LTIKEKILNFFKPRMVNVHASSLGSVDLGGYRFSVEYLMGLNPHTLKLRALQTLWKSVFAQGALNQTNVLTVNTGLRLQSMPSKFALKCETEECNAYALQIESWFDLVRRQKTCSFDETMNFDELSILARWSWDIFGEYFAVLRYNGPGISPVTVQLINPLLVKTPPNVGNKVIKDGIEFSGKKPVAFWIEESVENATKKGGLKYHRIPFKGQKSGLTVGVHQFEARVAGTFRGTPKLSAVFHELERIQAALRYEIDSMATNASIAMAIQRKSTVTNPKKFKSIVGAGGDLRVPYDEQLEASSVKTDRGGIIIQSGEPGEEFKELDTKRPNINMSEFVSNMVKFIGPAIGISQELWLMLFGRAYSASKGSIDLSFKNFDQQNFKFAQGLPQKFLEAVTWMGVARGVLVLPGWSDSLRRAGYMVAHWLGIPKPSLNPLQEAKAATERIANVSSNRDRESQNASGNSFEHNANRQAIENDILAAQGEASAVSVETAPTREADLVEMFANSGIDIDDVLANSA